MPRKKIKKLKPRAAKKQFSLTWVFEPFEDHETFHKKRMFGGLSAYVHGRLIMLLCEDPGTTEYRGQAYAFDIWNGVLVPTDRSHHDSLIKDFPGLVSHPVLGKWLYLPMTDPEFENRALELSLAIARDDDRFGVYPKEKKPKK